MTASNFMLFDNYKTMLINKNSGITLFQGVPEDSAITLEKGPECGVRKLLRGGVNTGPEE